MLGEPSYPNAPLYRVQAVTAIYYCYVILLNCGKHRATALRLISNRVL